jgi:hypothetical protein
LIADTEQCWKWIVTGIPIPTALVDSIDVQVGRS